MGPANDGVSFANIDGNDNTNHNMNIYGCKKGHQGERNMAQVTCCKCGEKGHLASKCTTQEKKEKKAKATLVKTADITDEDFEEVVHTPHYQFLQHSDHKSATVLNQVAGAVPKTWILLNNQSTVDVFYNKDLLVNVRCGRYVELASSTYTCFAKWVGRTDEDQLI
jgi:hypothetical protein